MNAFRIRRVTPLFVALLGTTFSTFAAPTPAQPPKTSKNPVPTPQEIVQKMETIYKTVKSYECAFTLKKNGTSSGGKPIVIESTNRYKYKAPNLFYIELKLQGRARPVTEISVSDGKSMIVDFPELKVFQKRVAPKTAKIPYGFFQSMMPETKGVALKMKPGVAVNGKATYVIEIPAPVKDGPVQTLYIDKTANTLLKFTSVNGQNSQELVMTSQSVNPTFTAATFDYKPAADAKERPAAAPRTKPLAPQGNLPKTPIPPK